VKGQRCDGDFEASKSRTFAVPVARAFEAFAKPSRRKRWLPVAVTIRSATPDKRMRIHMEDRTLVEVNFLAKGPAKCAVAIQHSKLADKAASERWKGWWGERLDALAALLT
jgi:hypothetical protein